jgi:hypothetical protein
VFFGGALLVLSACGDATAPTTMSHVGGALSVKLPPPPPATDTTGGKDDECSSIVIHVGLDGSLVPVCVLIPPPSLIW